MTQEQKPIKIHKSKRSKLGYVVIICALIIFALFFTFRNRKVTIEQYSVIDHPAIIRPDYSGAVIPPNIAPLNFYIQHDGSHYFVKIHSENGRPIEISSKTPEIVIPQKTWHELLNLNRGKQLNLDIYVKSHTSESSSKTGNGKWTRFKTLTNQIANDDIDSFLVYRKIHPVHRTWRDMGIYQRNLSSFNESLILHNKYFKHGCVNCHTFCGNRTDKMLISIRSVEYGSSVLLIEDEKVKKVGTKFGYSSWHPSGRVVTFSLNKVRQLFHSSANEPRDVMDFDSLMAYYQVDSKTIKTSSDLARKNQLETYPTWSPDGRYLYFCSAPITWSDRTVVPQTYDQIKYDLVRISYDLAGDNWGQLETVLSAEETGLSILLPRISPDGKWLLFCMCNYGCFPAYQQSSDLYIMNLEEARKTGKYTHRRLDINSDDSETWHGWSSNSRWIVFSSKRNSGVFTRTYIAYLDTSGKVHKSILLPQKNPRYYDSCLWTYSVPELIIEPVRVTKEKLGRVVRSSKDTSVQIPITMATPKAGTLPGHQEPWQAGRE
ncbi:MAG: hypothetical protein PVJ60_04770 [Phycisphaerales bacterium]|jgi:hypothetical protein